MRSNFLLFKTTQTERLAPYLMDQLDYHLKDKIDSISCQNKTIRLQLKKQIDFSALKNGLESFASKIDIQSSQDKIHIPSYSIILMTIKDKTTYEDIYNFVLKFKSELEKEIVKNPVLTDPFVPRSKL